MMSPCRFADETFLANGVLVCLQCNKYDKYLSAKKRQLLCLVFIVIDNVIIKFFLKKTLMILKFIQKISNKKHSYKYRIE